MKTVLNNLLDRFNQQKATAAPRSKLTLDELLRRDSGSDSSSSRPLSPRDKGTYRISIQRIKFKLCHHKFQSIKSSLDFLIDFSFKSFLFSINITYKYDSFNYIFCSILRPE